MTAVFTFMRLAMDSYTDEDGKWEPCTPAESAAMTSLAAALYLTPVVAFLYFLLF